MGQHRLHDLLRRADHPARSAESRIELLPELLEQVDMFGLLSRELKKGACADIVLHEGRAGMIEDEWQNELLDQTENTEIAVPADLV